MAAYPIGPSVREQYCRTIFNIIMTYIRTIKSYIKRASRLSTNRRTLLNENQEPFLFSLENLLTRQNKNGSQEISYSFDHFFPRKNPVFLEIGFGNGTSLREQVIQNQHINFIGIEVHKPGIAFLLNSAKKGEWQNIRLISGDAVVFLEQRCPPLSLSRIQIFFPDPWPKVRHHKRRLIQNAFLILCHQKLEKEGIIHLATDWQEYADHIEKMFEAMPQFFRQLTGIEKKTIIEARTETKFEQKGKAQGHIITDLVYQKLAIDAL